MMIVRNIFNLGSIALTIIHIIRIYTNLLPRNGLKFVGLHLLDKFSKNIVQLLQNIRKKPHWRIKVLASHMQCCPEYRRVYLLGGLVAHRYHRLAVSNTLAAPTNITNCPVTLTGYPTQRSDPIIKINRNSIFC